MLLDAVSFDGTSIAAGSDYDCIFPLGERYPVSIAVDAQSRRNTHPLILSISEDGRTIPMRVSRPAGVASATWNANVKNLFDPRDYADGVRYLVVTGDDGATQLRIGVHITNLEPAPIPYDEYLVTFAAERPYFEANALTTSAANPASVTNSGTTHVAPSIALTTSTHVTHRPCTVTGAGTGSGHYRYPVRFALSDAAATATNVYVFVEGVSVPCAVTGGGGASSAVWARIDTHADGTTATTVDIFYGTGLSNPLCGALDDYGMDLTNSTNTSWQWDDLASGSNPDLPGVWRPATTARKVQDAESFEISTDAAGTFAIQRYNDLQGRGDADSLILSLGGASAGTTNALTNVSRQTSGMGSFGRAYIRYRTDGSIIPATAWTATTDTTVTTAVDLDNAVEIIISIEFTTGTNSDPLLTLTKSGGANWTLALANTPTVVVGAAANYDHHDGTITIGADVITFTDLLVPNGTLTIDAGERTIESSVAGLIVGSITFSDPLRWVHLLPGANAVSNTLTGESVTVSHRAAYL